MESFLRLAAINFTTFCFIQTCQSISFNMHCTPEISLNKVKDEFVMFSTYKFWSNGILTHKCNCVDSMHSKKENDIYSFMLHSD